LLKAVAKIWEIHETALHKMFIFHASSVNNTPHLKSSLPFVDSNSARRKLQSSVNFFPVEFAFAPENHYLCHRERFVRAFPFFISNCKQPCNYIGMSLQSDRDGVAK